MSPCSGCGSRGSSAGRRAPMRRIRTLGRRKRPSGSWTRRTTCGSAECAGSRRMTWGERAGLPSSTTRTRTPRWRSSCCTSPGKCCTTSRRSRCCGIFTCGPRGPGGRSPPARGARGCGFFRWGRGGGGGGPPGVGPRGPGGRSRGSTGKSLGDHGLARWLGEPGYVKGVAGEADYLFRCQRGLLGYGLQVLGDVAAEVGGVVGVHRRLQLMLEHPGELRGLEAIGHAPVRDRADRQADTVVLEPRDQGRVFHAVDTVIDAVHADVIDALPDVIDGVRLVDVAVHGEPVALGAGRREYLGV